LKEMEGKILGAEERSIKLEYELFLRVREEVLGRLPAILQTAGALAQLDVLASFAETARLYGYCRPQVGTAGALVIRDGRHPVLEQNLSEERFVANDTELASLRSEPGGQGRAVGSPSSALRAPSPPLGEKDGMRGSARNRSRGHEITAHNGKKSRATAARKFLAAIF
jgi:hypothetical protein